MEILRVFSLVSKRKPEFNQIKRFLKYVPIETSNKITVSHKMTREIERKRIVYAEKEIEAKRNQVNKDRSRLMISCNRSQYNHYHGQTYKNFTEHSLASGNWHGMKSNGDYFTLNPHGPHPSINQTDDIKSFTQLGVSNQLTEILETKFNIKVPVKIQVLAIDKIRQHTQHHLILAQTGGGKTLAYVIPIIEEIMKIKSQTQTGVKRGFNSPIAVVILPTRELAFQVYEVFKKFQSDSNGLNFRAVIDLDQKLICIKEQYLNESIDHTLKSNLSDEPTDVLITMPSSLKANMQRNKNYITSVNLRKLVLDEGNLLLDDSNSPSILKILNKLNLNLNLDTEFSTQLLCVSATMPRDVKSILSSVMSYEFEQITTNSVNRLLLHVPQKFYRLSTKAKVEKLLELVKKDVKKSNSVMIFSNKVATAVFVYKLLKENDVDCVLFHSAIPDAEREHAMMRFLGGHIKVMSTTDIASRGLDTINLNHVINYEMPQFIADYVHRIGRVGRVGSKVSNAKVTTFVSRAYEVDTVWNIEKSIRTATDLHNLNANITRMLMYRYQPKYQYNEKQGKNEENPENFEDEVIEKEVYKK